MLKDLQLPNVISMSGWDLKYKISKKIIIREGLIACYNCIDVRNAKFRH